MNLGPYEANNIYCGNCADMMSQLPANSIDMVMTSPPYDNVDENMVTHSGKGLRDYNGYEWDFVSVADQLWRVMKPGGVVVWVVGDATVNGSETGSSFRQALYFKEVGFRLADTMIYAAKGTGAKGSNYLYWQGFEYMFVLSKGCMGVSNRIKDKRNVAVGVKRTSSPKSEKLKSRVESRNGRTVKSVGFRDNIWYYKASGS